MEHRGEGPPFVVSYLTLRKTIGLLGILLPVVLAVGDMLMEGRVGLRRSISAYYDGGMRDVFVGILFAAGTFLFAYRGHDRRDDVAGDLACLFALCVALFPGTSGNGSVRVVHYISGAGLFSVFAYFSIVLFTKTSPAVPTTNEKRKRNAVYRTCGWIMVGCIVGVGAYKLLLRESALDAIAPVFWLESTALWAFGWSWFIKGETLLTDH